MIKYLKEFFDEFEFNSTERVSLAIAHEKIWSVDAARELMEALIEGYGRKIGFLTLEKFDEADEISRLSGAHQHTVNLLLLILLTKKQIGTVSVVWYSPFHRG